MCPLNSLPLGDDIVDRIFTSLTDFKTLASLILTSKSMLAIFESHPNSIVRAICHNITGPVLRQAICVARYNSSLNADESEEEEDESQWFRSSKNPWSEKHAIMPITRNETVQLVEHAKTVQELEEIFTRRHKDRALGASLSFDESLRFRRALYRFWLYTLVFSEDSFPTFSDDEDDEEEDEQERNDKLDTINKYRRRQYRFLNQFQTDELQEIHIVSSFFIKLVESLVKNNSHIFFPPNLVQDSLFVGPEDMLEAYCENDPSRISSLVQDHTWRDLTIVRTYLSTPLSKAWKDRGVNLPQSESQLWKLILDSNPINEGEPCQKCNATSGYDLWNRTNWDRLCYSRFSRHIYLSNRMKGHLSQNRQERDLLTSYLDSPTFGYQNFISEIHQVKAAAFDDWNEDDLLCSSCLESIVADNLHLWLLEKKRGSGIPIPADNCWYGYNCRTQTHKPEHASKLNHLCDPLPQYA